MRESLLQIVLLFVVSLGAGQTNTPAWKNGPHEKMCGLGTYQDSLDLVFKNATEGSGDTLLTVEVLPSFQHEYAVVIKRVGSEVNLVRVKFRTQLWHQLAPLQAPRTRQECLGNITLIDTDNCPRRGKECALVHDGIAYVVLPKDGPRVRITDTEGLKGVRSENAALLDWIHKVLQVANNSKPQ